MESKIIVRTLKPGGCWNPLGGQIIGEPTVFSRRPDITDVFARGTDNLLWQNSWDRDHWTGWTPHNDGFILDSSPVADSMGPDHVHVFARGQDGQLWQKAWTAESGWNAWLSLGGQIIGAPAARSRRPNITDVFARGTDNLLWQNSWDRDHWTGWTSHNDGFNLDSSPVVDSMGPDHIHVFARGQDGQLWQKAWTAESGWNAWLPLGGQIIGAPAVRSRRPDITDVFARGSDNLLWQNSWDRDHWTGWALHNDGFNLDSSPVADSMAPDHVHIFARGQDGQLWQKWWLADRGWSGEIHTEDELAIIGEHPGIEEWCSENWEDIVVTIGAGAAAYFTGNPELAAIAKNSATNIANNIKDGSTYQKMAKSGRPYNNCQDYKQIAVIYKAWSEDSLKPGTCKTVNAPPEAKPYFEELQDKSYVVGYVLDTNTLPAGKTYPFIFGAQDDGWHNDVAVLNEVDIYFS